MERLKALQGTAPVVLSRTEHEAHVDTQLVRKRTQARLLSEKEGRSQPAGGKNTKAGQSGTNAMSSSNDLSRKKTMKMVEDAAGRNGAGRNRRNQNQTEGANRPNQNTPGAGAGADRRRMNQTQGNGRNPLPHSTSQNSIPGQYGSSYSLVDAPVSSSNQNSRPPPAPASAPGGFSATNAPPPKKPSLEVKPQNQGQKFETFGEMGFSSSKVQKDKECIIM